MMSEHEVKLAERIKALEVEVAIFKEGQASMEGKLDELLELKSKGMGAFWLASIIVGAIFTLVSSTVFDWFKG